MVTLPNDDSNVCSTSIYRKPTNTGVLLNFSAICPPQWKNAIMNCFISRAHLVSSSWTIFHEEICKLSNIFCSNGYPKHLFDNCVNRFLSKKFEKCDIVETQDKDEDRNPVIICIPYVGQSSLNFKNQLTKIFSRLNVKFRVVFKSFKVRNYFSLKDRTPKFLKSKVIYQFKASCDESVSYIGKTKRHFDLRRKEHLKGNSPIHSHINDCHVCQNSPNFEILDSGRNDFNLKIKEALYIKYRKPSLNTQIFQNGSQYSLNIF
jgi:hypothetical protein